MFQELCGPAAYKNVVVLTTFWDQISTPEGARREEQLKSNFFRKLVEGGAQFMRHDRTVESSRKVLRHILPMPPTITQFQKEIREDGKSLTETSAGSLYSQEVEMVLAKYKKNIADITEEISYVKESNEAIRKELEEELAKLRSSLRWWEQEQEELNKGLNEERELRKQLETDADELCTHLLRQIQSFSKEEKEKMLQEFQENTREAIDRALRGARKRPSRRLMELEITEDIPLPNIIGKPILGFVGLIFDAIRSILPVR